MANSTSVQLAYAAIAVILPAIFIGRRLRPQRRNNRIKTTDERVLVLGASSGVGRAIAKQYAARGARVCVVARRPDAISALAAECGDRGIGAVADFTKVDDMVLLREQLLSEWGGLDTIQLCAGVSALRPIMELTGDRPAGVDSPASGIQTAVDTAGRAVQGNFFGPLVAALTFIPMLTRTSTSPSVLLVSSAAAIIPAPTRALYAATKASSLLLFQALAIENPKIAWTFLLPSTIEGNFRASAVDGGPVREGDPNKQGFKIDHVAQKCVDAVDRGITGNIVLPWFFTLGHFIYYIWPSVIERVASKKYNFTQ